MADNDLARKIADIRGRAENARKAAARAEHDRDVAAAALTQVAETLRTEFGVTDAASAAAVRSRLEAELTAEVAAVDTALAAVPAQ